MHMSQLRKNLQISLAAAEGDPTVDVEDSDDEEDEGPATDSDEHVTASSRAVGVSMMPIRWSETSCKLESIDGFGC